MSNKSDKKEKYNSIWNVLGVIIFIVIIWAVYNHNTSIKTAEDNASQNSSGGKISFLQYQENWVNTNNMSVYHFDSEQEKLANWLNNTSEITPTYMERGNLFGETQYKITKERTDYLYMGETKDNLASGYGILYGQAKQYYGLFTYNNHAYDILYIGKFKDGRFDGYGLEFYKPEKYEQGSFEQFCKYSQDSQEYANYYAAWVNFVEYEGMFKEGKRDGKGNLFSRELDLMVSLAPLIELPIVDQVDFNAVSSGIFKDDEENGDFTEYSGEYLFYEGEKKDGLYDGKGTLYFENGQIKYKGEFKNGEYHGSGTEYDIDGNVIYSGKWKNGDYA